LIFFTKNRPSFAFGEKEFAVKTQYIYQLSDKRAALETVGGKGASLARLVEAGLPVPDGFHVTTMAYRDFVNQNNLQSAIWAALTSVDVSQPQTLDAASMQINGLFTAAEIPKEIANAVVQAYAALPGNNPAVAVRSSATAEDLPEASFAGQQETYLNVSSPQAVLQATRKCWASLWTARAIGYRIRQNIPANGVALAVVVQLLIPSEAAGILFTADPVSGQRSQMMVSASWGLGDAVVGGLVTPDTLTLEKSSGKVIHRETAKKLIQTVRINGGTEEIKVPKSLQNISVLSDEQAAELCQLGMKIEKLYDMPMDIEWTLADGKFAVVQARPITALPEPELPVPSEWTMPDPKGRYMRVSICELLPDPVTPLYNTLGLTVINRGIGVLCRDMFSVPEDLLTGFIMTINGYAYEQVSFTPKQWWLLLSKMVPRFPAMLKKGVPYWQDFALPQYEEVTQRWAVKSFLDLPHDELWQGACEIMDAFGVHLGALMASTMGPTAGSEGLFTNLYDKLIRQNGDPTASAFLMGFDNLPLQGEKHLYDLAAWCLENDSLTAYLSTASAEKIKHQLSGPVAPEDVDLSIWEDFQYRFNDHLKKYGYAIYDMDFSRTLPLDEPGPILEMLKGFINRQASNPYERQKKYAERRKQAMARVEPRLKGLRRWLYQKTLKWAQTQAPLREDGLAEIGLGYPVVRMILHELGRRFAQAGIIAQIEDIFWLEQEEVEEFIQVLGRGGIPENMLGSVDERKALWRARKKAAPPSQLPIDAKKYLGFEIDAHLAGGRGGLEGNIIKGVPTSPGIVTAAACVLHGPEDFDQMNPGDILVAGITTPAWTPLFAMAAGVVTDIGGPLSHGSIVAREYGIPAVLGTGVATKAIQNGQTITIDGNAGLVTIGNGVT
jgi:phosphohistidine swiveling domain-containing protein